MSLHGLIDVLIPRGGAGLIKSCVENSKVPVIETGIGNCHIYIHELADPEKARRIVVNAKCQRPSVCNAAESLLVDESDLRARLAGILKELEENGVTVFADEATRALGAIHAHRARHRGRLGYRVPRPADVGARSSPASTRRSVTSTPTAPSTPRRS